MTKDTWKNELTRQHSWLKLLAGRVVAATVHRKSDGTCGNQDRFQRDESEIPLKWADVKGR